MAEHTEKAVWLGHEDCMSFVYRTCVMTCGGGVLTVEGGSRFVLRAVFTHCVQPELNVGVARGDNLGGGGGMYEAARLTLGEP